MNLAIFDIDGTLTVSNEIDDACFVEAFRDVLGIQGISTNWLDYEHQTDSGLALEICRKHLARDPRDGEIERLQSRFAELLIAAVEGGRAIREVDGARVSYTTWEISVAGTSPSPQADGGSQPVSSLPPRVCRWIRSRGHPLMMPWIEWTFCGRPSGEPNGSTAGMHFRSSFTSAMEFGMFGLQRLWGLAS